MNSTFTRIALIYGVAMAAGGCVQRSPFLESQMGSSLTMIKAQQLINPAASSNSDSVAGIDAKAAQSTQDRYQQSFKAPQPTRNAFTIGIGSGR